QLKGIGPYTAAAISSFAFNEPNAVLDGNVFRVLARVFGVEQSIDTTDGKKYFAKLANELLDTKNAGVYNQAIMDFGALICKPAPVCHDCPLQSCCQAFLENRVGSFPKKTKKLSVRERWLHYVVVHHAGQVAIQQRVKKGIWHQLFEFLPIE